jgi:hypothetical protein
MPKRVKALLVAMTVAALGIFVSLAFIGGGGGGCSTPDAIVELIPDCNEAVFQQAPVGVQVANGYRAELTLNGTILPLDEVTSGGELPQDPSNNPTNAAQTRFLYFPREGQTIEQLEPVNTVVVTYWPIAEGEEAARTFMWTFEAA